MPVEHADHVEEVLVVDLMVVFVVAVAALLTRIVMIMMTIVVVVVMMMMMIMMMMIMMMMPTARLRSSLVARPSSKRSNQNFRWALQVRRGMVTLCYLKPLSFHLHRKLPQAPFICIAGNTDGVLDKSLQMLRQKVSLNKRR